MWRDKHWRQNSKNKKTVKSSVFCSYSYSVPLHNNWDKKIIIYFIFLLYTEDNGVWGQKMRSEFQTLFPGIFYLDLINNLEYITIQFLGEQKYWNMWLTGPVRLIVQTTNFSECLLLVLALGFACEDCICVWENINQPEHQKSCLWENYKPFEAYKREESIRAIEQALGIACTTTWNVLKKKEPLAYWATDIDRPR